MRISQQNKVYSCMSDADRQRVADFQVAGLSRGTAIASVVMQDIVASQNAAKMATYSRDQAVK